jgi:hypothetical protein
MLGVHVVKGGRARARPSEGSSIDHGDTKRRSQTKRPSRPSFAGAMICHRSICWSYCVRLTRISGSVRTLEPHIANVYAKLEINIR